MIISLVTCLAKSYDASFFCPGLFEEIRACVDIETGALFLLSLESIPGSHYYLCKYFELDEKLPKPYYDSCKKLATLHTKSLAPNGKFGFHKTTHNGDVLLENGFTGSWGEFLSNGLAYTLDLNLKRGSPWEGIQLYRNIMFGKMIPRLLRLMENNSRFIKPYLVNGDLWRRYHCRHRYGTSSYIRPDEFLFPSRMYDAEVLDGSLISNSSRQARESARRAKQVL